MSPELIAIITLGIGLGALLLGGIAFLFAAHQRSERLNKERFDLLYRRVDGVEQWMGRLERRIDAQDATIRDLATQVRSMENQVSRVGGLLEGLREAITRQPSQV